MMPCCNFAKVIYFLQKIISGAKEKFGIEPDALIGIHGRYTDYRFHLILRGAKMAGKKFYEKSIQYFKDKYKNPLFLVVSDDPYMAQALIFNDKKKSKDIYYVGTIADAMDGHMTKEISKGTDLAVLSMCHHIIISHGTYGMWAAFLASSVNTHIMSKVKSDKNIEEIHAVENANFTNIIFMDDK